VLSVVFNHNGGLRPLNVLCLGAHSDDIEIGCGGAILRLGQECPRSCFTWIVFSADGHRADEARSSANAFLANVEAKAVIVNRFRDGFFPYTGVEVKEYFEELKHQLSPDVIFTHHREDLHQDHRLIAELTWNTFRNHLILEYEIPKYDGDFGSPNFFVQLDEALSRQKTTYLAKYFHTQENRHWFTAETFLSVLRLRGVESRAPGGFAEGFYCRKLAF